MGAVGVRKVFEDLKEQGHCPLELERGSMSFKIWKNIKIKRIRVPDIFCIDCGCRIESRAKTSFEISMSHSLSDPERGWDYGLNDNDFVALVVCKRNGVSPIDWQADEKVQYISVGDLRFAQKNNHAILVKPKGAEEGFETRISWPAVIAKSDGKIKTITDEIIQYQRFHDNRVITLSLDRQGIKLKPFVQDGDNISIHQVLAAVISVTRKIPCSRKMSEDNYIAQLSSQSLSERYTAARVLSMFSSEKSFKALLDQMNNEEEHIYVRLEAAASLARHGQEEGWSFIEKCLGDKYLQNRLEAVIILGEIQVDKSCQMLCSVLEDNQQHPEIRAGAAWALGELHNKSALKTLVDSFSTIHESVRNEAAKSLAKLAFHFSKDLLNDFPQVASDKRPGIAWALSKSGGFELEDLLGILVDEDTRHWISYILGTQNPEMYAGQIEKLKERDPHVYFAVNVLWKIMTSWIYRLEEY